MRCPSTLLRSGINSWVSMLMAISQNFWNWNVMTCYSTSFLQLFLYLRRGIHAKKNQFLRGVFCYESGLVCAQLRLAAAAKIIWGFWPRRQLAQPADLHCIFCKEEYEEEVDFEKHPRNILKYFFSRNPLVASPQPLEASWGESGAGSEPGGSSSGGSRRPGRGFSILFSLHIHPQQCQRQSQG